MAALNSRITAAIATLLLSLSAGAGETLSEAEIKIIVTVAERQAQMYDAKIKSDLKAIYGMTTGEYRSTTSYEQFAVFPHATADERTIDVSGAKTSPDTDFDFYPTHLGYRFTDFYLSENMKMVKVVSTTTVIPPPVAGPITMTTRDEEYWVKTASGWEAQWETKYLIHASGAATSSRTPKLPAFKPGVKAADLARRFMDKAGRLPRGDKKDSAVKTGLLLDVFTAVKFLPKESTGALPLVRAQIKRQLLANPASSRYFTVFMEAGNLYNLAGDHEQSFSNYKMALAADGNRADALVRVVEEAVELGRFAEAARQYVKLLKLASITNRHHETSFERLLSGGCAVCARLSHESKIETAKGLINAQKWEPAFSLLKNIVTTGEQWPKTLEKLKAGKSVKLVDAVGEEVTENLGNLTDYELREILLAGDIALSTPGDMPVANGAIKGALTIESTPKVTVQIYEGYYKIDFIPASAGIKWDGLESSNSSTFSGGYLTVVLRPGSAPVKKFYPDKLSSVAGSRRLVTDINGLKNGDSMILSRVSVYYLPLHESLLAALSLLGVNASDLQGPKSAHVIAGTKGGEPGSAAVYEGKYAINKIFTPPDFKKAKQPGRRLLTLSGKGKEATIKYSP